MSSRDALTAVGLLIGLVWAVVTYVLMRRGKLKPTLWSRYLGIGAFIYGFAVLMISSIMLRPLSTWQSYLPANCFWSLLVAGGAYVTGLAAERRNRRR